MDRLLRNPTKTLAWTFACCTLGFFAVGWLASVERTLGLSWSTFRADLGFNFAAAFAQLVLAGVVWAQIKGANDVLRHAETTRERERNQRAADSLAMFVGQASNACSLYGNVVYGRCRDILAKPGDFACIEHAREAVAQANQPRQAAHAARFQVSVRTGYDLDVQAALEPFLDAIDAQHRAAGNIIAWSASAPPEGATPPDVRSIYIDPAPLRRRCLDLAVELLGK